MLAPTIALVHPKRTLASIVEAAFYGSVAQRAFQSGSGGVLFFAYSIRTSNWRFEQFERLW
jgi:hypothetical protein